MRKHSILGWVSVISALAFSAILIFGTTTSTSPQPLAFMWRPFILIPLSSVLLNMYLLFLVYKRRRAIKGVMWFGLFLLGVLLWSLTDLATFASANSYTALIVRAGIPVASLIGIPALLIFLVTYTSNDDEADTLMLPWLLMLAVSLFIIIVALTTNFIVVRNPSTLIPRPWGFEITLGPFGSLYLAWFQILTFIILGLLIRHYVHERKGKRKKQAMYLLIGILIPILGSTFTNVIPAYLGLPFYLPLDSFFSTIMALVMGYAIIRHSLFVINPTTIASNILETMAEAVVVVNPGFEVEYANTSAHRLFGLGNATRKRNIKNYFAPQHYKKIVQYTVADPTLKASKKIENLIMVTGESKHIVPVDLNLSALLDTKGKAAGYVLVITDISNLKRAYAQLAEEERKVEQKVIERTEELYREHAKLEASIASLPVGFIMLDENMQVLELNKVAKDLLKIESKSKKAISDALLDLGIKQDFEKVHGSCQLADIAELEHDKRILHLIISPIIDDKKHCIGSVLLIEDITKQKAAERERNDFIVTASHEMRTPLTIIQGNLANALDPDIAKLDKTTKPIIQQAYESTAQLAELFRDIMTVAEIDNGSAPHYENKTEFDYVGAIDDVIRLMRPKADNKKLALSFSGHEKKINLKADPNEVKEIIAKLVENAIKYTTHGFVSLELKEHGDWVLLSVVDTGAGINLEDRKKLFKKFDRLDNSLTREVGGTGLGLYIAQSLAERNGGEVMLEHSTKKGSVFTLKLPK